MFHKLWRDLRRSDRGQDLAEYCLITALLALLGFGLFYNLSGGIQGLWGTANSTAVAASASAGVGVGSAPVNH
jgi:Flp pilus assembly pilin Flp